MNDIMLAAIYDVPCPLCGARVGDPCIRPTGDYAKTHLKRTDWYKDRRRNRDGLFDPTIKARPIQDVDS